nr:hypothetical protein [Allomuricauda sp.]
MLPKFDNGLELLATAQKENLYDKLIVQIQKDFVRSNINFKIPEDSTPMQLNTLLHEKIYVLILERYDAYLNLLYAVDIPEREIDKLRTLDAVDASSKVGFMILKREWQKVWFKHKYNS